jgi:hypothetical protein
MNIMDIPKNEINNILRKIKRDVIKSTLFLRDLNAKYSTKDLGHILATASLLRIQTTFISTIKLIKTGCIFESSCLCRLIIEQFAYIYVVSSENDPDSILKIKPSKCVTKFKSLDGAFGNLYGILSNLSHINTPEVITYIKDTDDEKYLSVELNSENESSFLSIMLILLNEVRNFLIEYIHIDDIKVAKNLCYKDNKICFKFDHLPLKYIKGKLNLIENSKSDLTYLIKIDNSKV